MIKRSGASCRRSAAAHGVEVKCLPDDFGEKIPCAFTLGNDWVEVVEFLDCWLAQSQAYYKLRGHDGATYILRHDDEMENWELTFFNQTSLATRAPAGRLIC